MDQIPIYDAAAPVVCTIHGLLLHFPTDPTSTRMSVSSPSTVTDML